MHAKVEHSRDIAADLAEGVLADDGEGDTGRADILLGASVYHSIFADIHRTAHNVGRHIRDERNRTVDILVDFGAVNRVVGGDVEVVGIGRVYPLGM